MSQDSVPAGSYNDPFLSSVCVWVMCVCVNHVCVSDVCVWVMWGAEAEEEKEEGGYRTKRQCGE